MISAVLAEAEAIALAAARDDRQASLIARAFEQVRAPAEQDNFRFYIDFPLLLHAALTGDMAAAQPLAVVTTLVYLGAGALDDVADGECASHWDGVSPSQVELAGVLMLAALPQVALRRVVTTPETALAMHCALADGIAEMVSGQLADLSMTGADEIELEAVIAAAAAKSGGETAMFARLAALLAGSDPQTVERCVEIGRAIGTAGQLASDCADIFKTEPSPDLSNGTRSLPIALHLRGLKGAARTGFLHLLDGARHDPAAQETVRRELLASGCVRACGVIAGVHVQTAERGLEAIARFTDPAEELRQEIARFAFARRS